MKRNSFSRKLSGIRKAQQRVLLAAGGLVAIVGAFVAQAEPDQAGSSGIYPPLENAKSACGLVSEAEVAQISGLQSVSPTNRCEVLPGSRSVATVIQFAFDGGPNRPEQYVSFWIRKAGPDAADSQQAFHLFEQTREGKDGLVPVQNVGERAFAQVENGDSKVFSTPKVTLHSLRGSMVLVASVQGFSSADEGLGVARQLSEMVAERLEDRFLSALGDTSASPSRKS